MRSLVRLTAMFFCHLVQPISRAKSNSAYSETLCSDGAAIFNDRVVSSLHCKGHPLPVSVRGPRVTWTSLEMRNDDLIDLAHSGFSWPGGE
ncbi:hypothetical protein RRG08_014745 [Elysia crispata]|uniref:Secreted protein n=1 Tax=Elysia crispata TaxID=231223 RepID=A0AAE1ASP2_9GAST|nr:hypothetical protein RRG08_014745 [Elysia crispata]